MSSCMHTLMKYEQPIPASISNRAPWRYWCTKCKLRFKILNGAVIGTGYKDHEHDPHAVHTSARVPRKTG